MAKYNLINYTAADGLGFPKNFRRGNPNPLDNSSVWSSYEAALNYAQTDPVAYVGQVLSVVNYTPAVEEEGVIVTPSQCTVDVYKINDEAGTLLKVGTSPVGDESTITVAEDGTVSLYGIAGLPLEREVDGVTTTINYQPLLVNGKLTWVEPSATTVEGLATEIEGVKTEISDLKTQVATDIETASKAAEDAAVDRVLGYLADEEINKDFDTLKEVAAWIESDTTQSAQLITRVSDIEADYLKGADKTALQGKIDDLTIFVGTLPEGSASTTVVAYIQEVVAGLNIGDYAKASELTALADRVKAVEDKLAGIEAGANKYVHATHTPAAQGFYKVTVDGEGHVSGTTAVSKEDITALGIPAQDTTYEAVTTSADGLMAAADKSKLDGVDAGAQVNAIDSVDTAQFGLDENKNLTLLNISIDKVTGLQEALNTIPEKIQPLTTEEIDSIFTT